MLLSLFQRRQAFAVALFCFALTAIGNADEDLQLNSVEAEDNPDLKDTAENVCVEQKYENKTLNVTYMQTLDVKEYTWCLAVPPRCPVFKQKLVESVKQENVSRLVNYRKCCPGFAASVQKTCEPVCDEPCDHGICFEPNTCSCTPGYSGKRCEKFGCPEGNWGPNCKNKCPCVNGGSCEPHSGKCLCLPGWTGLNCQSKCDASHYGPDCSQKCACKDAGEKCYHVTGDCLPCSPGTFGQLCSQTCKCNANGTALCYHLNGNCFCHPNWYGPKCDLYCPFGYVDGVCYNRPMSNESACSCPGDMYECDPVLGCVCNEDSKCRGGSQIFSLAPLSAPEDLSESSTNSSAIAIVVSVLIIALLITILGIWYYRRRAKLLQKDLQNRSVYYVENSILDPMRHHQHDLAISNADPAILSEESEEPSVFTAPVVPAPTSSVVQNNLLMKPRYEKNVNIDAFKLGPDAADMAGRSTPLGACSTSGGRGTPMSSGGACGSAYDDPEETLVVLKKPSNVNLFDDDDFCEAESPLTASKKKNNAMLEQNRKINKPKISSVLNNRHDGAREKPKYDDSDDDEVAMAKVSNYFGSYPDGEK